MTCTGADDHLGAERQAAPLRLHAQQRAEHAERVHRLRDGPGTGAAFTSLSSNLYPCLLSASSPFPSPFSPRPFSLRVMCSHISSVDPRAWVRRRTKAGAGTRSPRHTTPTPTRPSSRPRRSTASSWYVLPPMLAGRERKERCTHTFKHVRKFWVLETKKGRKGRRVLRPSIPTFSARQSLSTRCCGSEHAAMCVKQSLVDDYMPKNEHGEPAKMSVYPGAGVMSEAGGAYPDGSR